MEASNLNQKTKLINSHHNHKTIGHHAFTGHHFYGSEGGKQILEAGDSGQDSNKQDQQNNRTTDGQTMMHILKANIGTGVLAMPNAFRHVGLWIGFVLVPIIGATCIHCMNILIASHNHLCDKFNYESLDYDQVAALGLACGPKLARRLAKRAHIVVTVFLIFTQLGFCCVYIMFVVENIQLAILNLFHVQYSTTTYLMLVFPLIGLTSCTSNLKHLARISTLANILQLAGLALIFFDLLQFHTYSGSGDSSNKHSQQEIDDGDAASSLNQHTNTNMNLIGQTTSQPNVHVKQVISSDIQNGLPLFFATAVYAFEGIGVVLPLIKEMQYPSRISGQNGVLNTSMSMVAILYMGMGFFGYAKYGQFVQGSITLNLPQTTLNEIVRIVFAIAIGLSYSLQFYVPWTIMWPFIDESLFYSYRPRESRDKLEILNKLSAENEWAIDESEWQQNSSHQQQQQLAPTTTTTATALAGLRQRPPAFLVAGAVAGSGNKWPAQSQQEAGDSGGALDGPDGHYYHEDLDGQEVEQEREEEEEEEVDNNSTASTFATSYAVSTYHQQSGRILRRLPQQQQQLQLSSSLANSLLASSNQYGAVSISGQQATGAGGRAILTAAAAPNNLKAAQGAVLRAGQRRRNRLDDVMEQEDDEMPEVQWRPPPRSMRGKRKLVRYTVILVSVSFTFVAAALIPRLDLFIALIGALASSCLAIIFPAIIQMCTFWGHEEEEEDDDDESLEEDNNHFQDNDHQCHKSIGGANSDDSSQGRSTCSRRRSRSRRRRSKRRKLLWWLFVFKNMLLIVFGILGLITGSWISLSQLSAAYMGIESETANGI